MSSSHQICHSKIYSVILAKNGARSDEIFIDSDTLMFFFHHSCRKKTGSITTRIYETFLAILESRHNGCCGIEEKKREYRVSNGESTRLIPARVYLLTTSTFSREFFTIKGTRTGIKGSSSTRFHANTRT